MKGREKEEKSRFLKSLTRQNSDMRIDGEGGERGLEGRGFKRTCSERNVDELDICLA